MKHCAKECPHSEFFSPVFPAFGLNTVIYIVNVCLQSKYGKTRTKKSPDADTFHVVLLFKDSEFVYIFMLNHLRVVIYFRKKLYLKCLTGLWIGNLIKTLSLCRRNNDVWLNLCSMQPVTCVLFNICLTQSHLLSHILPQLIWSPLSTTNQFTHSFTVLHLTNWLLEFLKETKGIIIRAWR